MTTVLHLLTICVIQAMALQNIPGTPGVDYPVYARVPRTRFFCQQEGYFADVEAGCQVFHVCQRDGRMSSFLCPNGTIFHQPYSVCIWWYEAECSSPAGTLIAVMDHLFVFRAFGRRVFVVSSALSFDTFNLESLGIPLDLRLPPSGIGDLTISSNSSRDFCKAQRPAWWPSDLEVISDNALSSEDTAQREFIYGLRTNSLDDRSLERSRSRTEVPPGIRRNEPIRKYFLEDLNNDDDYVDEEPGEIMIAQSRKRIPPYKLQQYYLKSIAEKSINRDSKRHIPKNASARRMRSKN